MRFSVSHKKTVHFAQFKLLNPVQSIRYNGYTKNKKIFHVFCELNHLAVRDKIKL